MTVAPDGYGHREGAVGSVGADVVAVEARKAAGQRTQAPTVAGPALPERVVSLTARRLAALAFGDRPLPSVDVYDQLLRRESS